MEASELLNEFKRINSSVEVVSYQVGDANDPVLALDGFWLKVTTKHHGWLHVYINRDSKCLEWY